MNILRRLLASAITVALALSCAPAFALAEEGVQDDILLPGGIVADPDADGALGTQSEDDSENAGHLDWTAVGLFKYIRDNSAKGSAEYEDAALALKILYGTDGYHSEDLSNYVDFESESGPASLVSMKKALAYIDEYNSYRARENKEEGTSLSTNVGTNCTMLAISIVQCSYSDGIYITDPSITTAHSGAFSVGENLAWGYDPDSSYFKSPFEGWYEKEKGYYKGTIEMPSGCWWGHYLNIVSESTLVTGFAVSMDGAYCGSCHEQSFSSGSFADVVYTTKQFRSRWFNKYYAAQRAEGMGVHFYDVDKGHWGYSMIRRAVGSGFMNGYSGDREGYFGPNDKVTRGMVATILWNMEGKPQASGGAGFSDVSYGKWYYDAVRWASSAGVVDGYGDGTFGPERNVTRQELAAMLYKYARYKGLDLRGASESAYASMSDGSSVASYARRAVGWCYTHKLLSGTKDGRIDPTGAATRAQVAKMVVMLSQI